MTAWTWIISAGTCAAGILLFLRLAADEAARAEQEAQFVHRRNQLARERAARAGATLDVRDAPPVRDASRGNGAVR